eukprot:3441337-Pyramimonas_sp.AAC.1
MRFTVGADYTLLQQVNKLILPQCIMIRDAVSETSFGRLDFGTPCPLVCPAGYYEAADHAENATALEACLPCPPGTAAPTAGAGKTLASCASCAPRSVAPLEGAATCQVCNEPTLQLLLSHTVTL